ncbi:MAG: hypothetical protein GC184_05295 [Rhizobiales bacterium]|nr:hypothetical protein [Hyphomicrobiales bacterium]
MSLTDDQIPSMVLKWRAAWQSLDPDRIAAIYHPDATHMSAVVVERMQRADGTLRGVDEIRAYATISAQRLTSFKADVIDVLLEERRAGVEYWRVINGDEAKRTRVMEILEWRGDKISGCRVFHF